MINPEARIYYAIVKSIEFGKVNVDDNQEIAKKFQVVSIPNMKLIRDGRIIDEFVGGMTADDFEKKLEKFVRN